MQAKADEYCFVEVGRNNVVHEIAVGLLYFDPFVAASSLQIALEMSAFPISSFSSLRCNRLFYFQCRFSRSDPSKEENCWRLRFHDRSKSRFYARHEKKCFPLSSMTFEWSSLVRKRSPLGTLRLACSQSRTRLRLLPLWL